MPIQYTVPGFELTTFGTRVSSQPLEHESPPITTRPGLPPTFLLLEVANDIIKVVPQKTLFHQFGMEDENNFVLEDSSNR